MRIPYSPAVTEVSANSESQRFYRKQFEQVNASLDAKRIGDSSKIIPSNNQMLQQIKCDELAIALPVRTCEKHFGRNSVQISYRICELAVSRWMKKSWVRFADSPDRLFVCSHCLGVLVRAGKRVSKWVTRKSGTSRDKETLLTSFGFTDSSLNRLCELGAPAIPVQLWPEPCWWNDCKPRRTLHCNLSQKVNKIGNARQTIAFSRTVTLFRRFFGGQNLEPQDLRYWL